MKLLNVVCYYVAVIMTSGWLVQHPQAKITLRVVNQNEKPVTDTEITASFENGKADIRKKPDENGYVTFSSPVMGSAIFSNVVYKTVRNPNGFNKYYNTIFRYDYDSPSENVKDGKWQPWNPVLTIVLKERVNPIPMYANGRQHDNPIPVRNEWIGFDMTKNDWLSPYGKGSHADVEIIHEWDGKDGREYTGSTLRIRFPDKDAGYYAFHYEPRKMYDSVRYKAPYHAIPAEMYQKEMTFSERINSQTKKLERKLFPEGTGYVFRTRTRFDGSGRLVGAHYGKIYQPHSSIFNFWHGCSRIRLPFYLNPTENDTNLEFDPEHNLLKDVHGYVEP